MADMKKMTIDFWKDYDGKGDDIPALRVDVIKHSFHYSTWEYTGLEMVRIEAYANACGIDLKTTPINAEFMNTMEEWYLKLAEKVSEGNSNDASYQHTINELNKVVQEQAEEIRALKESKTGRWIWELDETPSTPVSPYELNYVGWVCSCCHEFPDDICEWDNPDEPPTYKYCPNCGADMRGE